MSSHGLAVLPRVLVENQDILNARHHEEKQGRSRHVRQFARF